MTIENRLNEIEERAEMARAVYNMHSPEHREIALAKYTMGEEYIVDVPKLVSALRVAIDALQNHYAKEENYYDAIKCGWDDFEANKTLTEIERILNAEGEG